jgi:regulator of protease activity HflC (stomatin/prohibitin superfamily)
MNHSRRAFSEGNILVMIILLVIVVAFLILGVKSCTVIEPGQTGVQVTFGSVNEQPLKEGMHVINPLSNVVEFDVRQQSHTEDDVTVPSRDQLQSQLDVSVQYTLNPALTPKILKEIGDIERVKSIVLVPKLRSALREATKTIDRAEDYMTNETQTKLQKFIEEELKTLEPMGITISEVLVRDIKLPQVIATAVQQKKEREQAAVRQEAELQRFTVEQQQKVAQATAEKTAAEQAALRMRIEADAEAYKIKTLNEAAASSPVYVQLKALETLNELSKNPAHKLFFIDNKGQYPVPLLHMGADITPTQVIKAPETPKK